LLKAIKSKFGKTYLDTQGNWVLDVAHARKFSTSADLAIYAEDHGLKWYEVEEVEVPPVPRHEAPPKPREVIIANGHHGDR
jgi:hypothetical protein